MKFKISYFFSILFLSIVIMAACKKNPPGILAAKSPSDTTTMIKIVHPKTVGNGNGVNLQPSYYNSGNVNLGFDLMKTESKIKSVRIEIEPSESIDQAKSWIQQAVSNGYSVIATYHKYKVLGSDNLQDLMDAAIWWKSNYVSLSSAGAFTINIMNEWGSHNISSNNYASAYNMAIATIRTVYKGTLILDSPGYGQETHTAFQAITGANGTKIIDTNIIPSVHIYPNGYNQALNHNFQSADLDDLASAGRGVIVGEFGNSPSGPVDWSGMVNYAKTKGWTIMAWAWNGDGGSMNMVSPAWVNNATASTYTPCSYFSIIYNLL